MDSVANSEVTSLDEDCDTLSLLTVNDVDISTTEKKSEYYSDLNSYDCAFDENEDTRSELKFDQDIESIEENCKRQKLESALKNGNTSLDVWRKLAVEECGLVNDDLRRKIWPLLLEVDTAVSDIVPSLEELSFHSEYNQVVLDVNRSLKRFPPGIPYKQRLALQDQLTVLILRVILKYPHLRYYQGYHDVAITFLLVVGETLAFRIMERLSTDHLRECMEPTLEATSYSLNYFYPILKTMDPELHDHIDSSAVGTMFALPWHLTWFGHSLKRYRDVVRLYDYFLALPSNVHNSTSQEDDQRRSAPPTLFVAAALAHSHRTSLLGTPADMAAMHCALTRLPEADCADEDYEDVLCKAKQYYDMCNPKELQQQVQLRIENEQRQRKLEEELRAKYKRQRRSRRDASQRNNGGNSSSSVRWTMWWRMRTLMLRTARLPAGALGLLLAGAGGAPPARPVRRGAWLAAAAAAVLVAVYAYNLRVQSAAAGTHTGEVADNYSANLFRNLWYS